MKLYAGMMQGPRNRQEDCLLIGDRILQQPHLPLTRIETNFLAGIAAVSDGMGGAPDGDWASHECCHFLSRLTNALAYCDAIPTIIEALHSQICQKAQFPQCGATLTGIIYRPDDHATLIHLGDSRAYLKRPDQPMEQLTVDHSPVMDRVLAGELSPEAAHDHPMRNIVDLGVGPAFGPNWEASHHQPLIRELDLHPGDRVMLTTDGFHAAVDPGQLEAFLAAFDPEQADEMFQSFGHDVLDNASVIVIEA